MGKNIIICSDGTGNTFDSRVTNVTHLIECLALGNHKEQVAVYDQGVGTTANRCSKVHGYRESLKDKGAFASCPLRSNQSFGQRRGSTEDVDFSLGTVLRKMFVRCIESCRICMRDPTIECFCLALAAAPSRCVPWPGCCIGASCRNLKAPTSKRASCERGKCMNRCLRMRQQPCSSARSSDRALIRFPWCLGHGEILWRS